jgi:hypothetical protein
MDEAQMFATFATLRQAFHLTTLGSCPQTNAQGLMALMALPGLTFIWHQ